MLEPSVCVCVAVQCESGRDKDQRGVPSSASFSATKVVPLSNTSARERAWYIVSVQRSLHQR